MTYERAREIVRIGHGKAVVRGRERLPVAVIENIARDALAAWWLAPDVEILRRCAFCEVAEERLEREWAAA